MRIRSEKGRVFDTFNYFIRLHVLKILLSWRSGQIGLINPENYPSPPPPPPHRNTSKFVAAGTLVAIIVIASIAGVYYFGLPKTPPTPTLTPTPIGNTITPMPIGNTPTPSTPARPPTISGLAVLPNLDVTYTNNLPGGGLHAVYLLDLSWNTLSNVTHETPADNSYSFTVAASQSYILEANYNGGQVLTAIVPGTVSDMHQDITVDTEVAADLIVATEHAYNDLQPSSLSRPLNQLLADANQEVTNLNDFYANRNQNRSADCIADAVHNMVMDQLNKGKGVSLSLLNAATIRAYGGGLQGIRSLSDMLRAPNLPLNPQFTFTRYNSTGGYDWGISDLANKRWDYMGAGGLPSIAVGGTLFVWSAPPKGSNGLCVYSMDLSQPIPTVNCLTPNTNLECWSPAVSPDQTKIAFAAAPFGGLNQPYTQPFNIYVMNADGSNLTEFTHYRGPLAYATSTHQQGANDPSWSPDGSKIVFDYMIQNSTGYSTENSLEMINSDGTNQHTLFSGGGPESPLWSPDSSAIVFSAWSAKYNGFQMCRIPSDYKLGDNYTVMHVVSQSLGTTVLSPSYSYDGRFILFSGNSLNGAMGPDGTPLKFLYVVNAYTLGMVADFGNFANAANYAIPKFIATPTFLVPAGGTNHDSSGNVISTGSDPRLSDNPSTSSTYRAIDAARNFNDPLYGGYINYYIPDW